MTLCKVCKDECACNLSLLLSEISFNQNPNPVLEKLTHLCPSSKIPHKSSKDKFEATKVNLKNLIELPKLKEYSIV